MPHQTNHLPKRQATRSVPHPLSCDTGPTCYQPSCWLYRPLLSPAPNSIVRTPDLCFLPCPKSLYTTSNSSILDFCSCPDCVQNSSSFQSPLRSLSKIFFGPPSSPLPHLSMSSLHWFSTWHRNCRSRSCLLHRSGCLVQAFFIPTSVPDKSGFNHELRLLPLL